MFPSGTIFLYMFLSSEHAYEIVIVKVYFKIQFAVVSYSLVWLVLDQLTNILFAQLGSKFQINLSLLLLEGIFLEVTLLFYRLFYFTSDVNYKKSKALVKILRMQCPILILFSATLLKIARFQLTKKGRFLANFQSYFLRDFVKFKI